MTFTSRLLVVSSLVTSCRTIPPPTPSADPRAVFEQAVRELFNQGHLEAAERLFAPGFAAEERRFTQVVRGAFPDLVIELDRLVQDGPWVAVHWTARGTHRGDFGDLQATGRHATWSGAWFWKVERGQIVDGKALNVWDQKGLREQLAGTRP